MISTELFISCLQFDKLHRRGPPRYTGSMSAFARKSRPFGRRQAAQLRDSPQLVLKEYSVPLA